ncbi:phosphate acyltransferase PlsX [Spiroplasma endosymbiont of Crioceris asparagi]|uniref:phosphate acyltransferase PlsX n=1 Tax=Spiroplasma endosymbiont of Crioceris asparagi TaxID=3066286 RepID=UPI0030D3B4D8
MEKIKIAFDIMGSDEGPIVAINAALNFIKKNKDVILYLVGDEKIIKEKIKQEKDNLKIVPATQQIEMTDGIFEIRRKKDSSMAKSLELVKDNVVDAMITAGATAPYIAGCHLVLGEMPGISRPGFMPIIPTMKKGRVTCLLDVGANLENDPNDLVNYALMASVYQKEILNNSDPLIGLLNIGEEESKGKDLQKQTFKLLKANEKINFFGNIEGRDIFSGKVDVIVSDGYSGNILLKTMEGSAKAVTQLFKDHITKTIIRKIACLFLLRAFKSMKKTMDVRDYGGAILLGVNGIVFKAHGSSDEKGFAATLRFAKEAVKHDVLNKIKEKVQG